MVEGPTWFKSTSMNVNRLSGMVTLDVDALEIAVRVSAMISLEFDI